MAKRSPFFEDVRASGREADANHLLAGERVRPRPGEGCTAPTTGSWLSERELLGTGTLRSKLLASLLGTMLAISNKFSERKSLRCVLSAEESAPRTNAEACGKGCRTQACRLWTSSPVTQLDFVASLCLLVQSLEFVKLRVPLLDLATA